MEWRGREGRAGQGRGGEGGRGERKGVGEENVMSAAAGRVLSGSEPLRRPAAAVPRLAD